MAKATMKMPDEFLIKLSKLGSRTDEIIPKILEAGAKVVLEKVKSNLASVIGSDTKYESRSTGQLLSALGVSPAKLDKDGNYNVKIGFAENRRDGVANALIANVIEFGKLNQPPRPFLKPAKSASQKACIAAMIAAFESEANKK
ncbi:hypothetical protein FACS1894219_09980 [Clostridia bacterium]|nr:hypothetical protein FACS1894219_09980 [Clostridia bacterium]